MYDTITALMSAHFALTHPALIAAVTGANPFADVAAALLAIANVVKVPLAVIAFVMAGGAQALHLPRASGMWISAVLGTVTLFGSTGIATYLESNTH